MRRGLLARHGLHLTAAQSSASSLPRSADLWHLENRRPPFDEIVSLFHRLGWSEPFLDPPSDGLARQIIQADYIARVVAAA